MPRRPDKFMIASAREWLLVVSTRHAQPQRRMTASWWSWLWSLLLTGVGFYGSLGLLFPLGMTLRFTLEQDPPLIALGVLTGLLLALGAAGVALAAWWTAHQRRQQARTTALNEESWDTMTQVVARLGGYLAPHDAVRGMWFQALRNDPRNTWSLQTPLGEQGHVEVDYLITPEERRLRVAAQSAPGQTQRQLETIIPAQEANEDTPVLLAEQLGRFLLSVSPEALPEALRQPATWRLGRRSAQQASEPADKLTASLRPLRPALLRPNARRHFLHRLVSWESYNLVFLLGGASSLGALLLSLASVGLSLGPSWGLGLLTLFWSLLFGAVWWLARPARPAARAVRDWSSGLSLEGQTLHIQGQGEIDLEQPFRLHLSRAPGLEGAQAALLVVELSQRAQGQAQPLRLRLCTPVQHDSALEGLPELLSEAPLVDADTFAGQLWPRLQYAAALHGVDPGWSMEPVQASRVAQQEVAAQALSQSRA